MEAAWEFVRQLFRQVRRKVLRAVLMHNAKVLVDAKEISKGVLVAGVRLRFGMARDPLVRDCSEFVPTTYTAHSCVSVGPCASDTAFFRELSKRVTK